jgi:uncharacterized protein (TIGR02452 family)
MSTLNRSKRATLAKETVAICDQGFYISPSGEKVEIAANLDQAERRTVLYSPENQPTLPGEQRRFETRFEVRNETTFAALARLENRGGHLGCLNFASAKNAGGGFLNGSLAQEEALACASGLYPCLLNAPGYYERNRANRSTLYLDLTIFSPLVPFFRDDNGTLLEKPVVASVITAPAPNAGAIAANESGKLDQIEPTLRRRADFVLQIAKAHEIDRFVLGAWGCGVFRNDPNVVAGIFAELLMGQGKWAGAFPDVVFAVYDRSADLKTFQAFANAFGKGAA